MAWCGVFRPAQRVLWLITDRDEGGRMYIGLGTIILIIILIIILV